MRTIGIKGNKSNKRKRKIEYPIQKKCKCGCGQIVKKGNTWINGHNANFQTHRTSEFMRQIAIKGNKQRVISDETRRRLSIARTGEKSGCWKGGISYEPYCEQWLDQDYKKSIKERDEYRCLNPECNKTCKILSIHHIDYNKKNCHPSNLITVCLSCNSKANKNRNWHTSWYKAILYRRYGII